MKILPSIIGGLAGSVALTILHQCLVKKTDDAPRMDKLGMDALNETFEAWDIPVPEDEKLYNATLAGDIAGNAAYYALAGLSPKHSCLAGSLLGITAGAGAILLPEHIGLNKEYSSATPKTKAMTLLLYLTGGLVSGAVYKLMSRGSSKYPKVI